MVEAQRGDASRLMQHLIKECVDGNLRTSKQAVKTNFWLLATQLKVEARAEGFCVIIRLYVKTMSSGSLAKPQQLIGTADKIKTLQETLTALGQDNKPGEMSDVEAWVDLPGIKDLVARMADKVKDTRDGVSVAKKNKLADEI